MKPATRPSVKRGGTPDNRLHHATTRDGSLFIPLIFHRCNRREDFALRAQKRAFMGISPQIVLHLSNSARRTRRWQK
jgi:hypothetical protein